MRKINTRNYRLATRATPREVNRRIVLNLIREHQPISRAELARRMNVRRAALTAIVRDLLHAGDFVEVYLDAGGDAARASKTSVTIPTAAVVQLQGDSVVFRREASGAFLPVPVRVGETLGAQTLVQDGLKAGDVIVVDGAFDLKAQMLKSQMGEGHGD